MRDAVRPLHDRLDLCTTADAARLRRRLEGLDHALRHGRHPRQNDQAFDAIAADLDRAVARAAARLASLPTPTFPEDLPIAARKDEIANLIREHQVVIVCGETGSGKSTQLPKICLELGRGVRGFIGHTQPRRIAARSIAQRLSEELGTPLGKAVGYKVRFTDRTSPDSFIKVMTDGILLAETQQDRLLLPYDTIIIDEAHERSLNIDFLLGFLKLLLPHRPDLKVIVTSATIDPQRFAAHFETAGVPAPIIEVSGRTYPVETRYRPLKSEDPDEADRTLEHAILDAVDEVSDPASPGHHGDILVFLPGEREIRETAEELSKHHVAGTGRHADKLEILPLYARLSADEQHRVFERKPGTRRIVLATNVAETSLTVPGITSVIDTGVARVLRYSTRSGVQGLPIERVSRASADQRAGRCGRVAPGVCIRLYSREDYEERDPFTPPEIVRTNLASVILQMKALRLGEVESFPFVEAPSPRAIQDGYATLTELHAIDDKGRLTQTGRLLARLPIDPRIARMVLAAEKEGCLAEVLVIAAALSVQDPRERSAEKRDAADKAQKKFINAHIRAETPPTDAPPIPGVARQNPADLDPSGSDFMVLVNIWNLFQRTRRDGTSGQLRKWCKEHYLGYMRMREWADVHAQLLRIVTEMGHAVKHDAAHADVADEGLIHRALLTGLLSNVGRYDEESREYAGAHGSKFSIHPGSAMAFSKARWIMAGERVRTTRVYARAVARIRPEWIEELAPHLVTRSYSEPVWNERTGTAHVFETVFLYGLEVIPRRRASLAQIDPAAARQLFINHALIDGKYHTDAPFVAHNRRLLDEAHRLEAKVRRRDLTADLSRRIDFYDRHLPSKVTGGGVFERWRHGAQKTNPRLLFMSLSDLLRDGASLPPDGHAPDSITLAAGTFPLSYQFQPGENDDGITIILPIGALGAIDPGPLEWLVPGWELDKASELLRGLPKEIRKAIGPAPQAAEAFIRSNPDRSTSMLAELASYLSRTVGVPVPLSAFSLGDLPNHLLMRALITDARGRPLASGRNITALREQLRSQIGESLSRARTPFNRSGLGDWEFGDIPETVEVDAGGARVPAYPALADEGRTVGLKLFDSPESARRTMRAGLRRLFALRVKGEIKAALDHAPGLARCVSLWGPHGKTAELHDTLTLMVAERAFLHASGEPPRTFTAFTTRIDEGFGSIVTAALDTVALVTPLLESLQRLALKLELLSGPRSLPEWQPALDGVRNQLDHLCPRGFLLDTHPNRLAQFPRYLRGIEARLEKVQIGKIAADQKWAAELRPHLRRWLDALPTADRLPEPARAALDEYRWMLEEYRLMLFAQEQRTGSHAPAISSRKLDEQWDRFAASR